MYLFIGVLLVGDFF